MGLEISELPANLVCVFCYFKGRYHLYNNEMTKARLNLRTAMQLAVQTKEGDVNLTQIMRFLIPAEMQIGSFPSDQMLTEFDLVNEYSGIRDACISGDIQTLESEIEKNMQIYLSSGVYLTVEKLRHLTLRNLFKKIAVSQIESEPSELQAKPVLILPLSTPFKMLIGWDKDLDIDELECILAGLISIGYIKGYISHEKQFLVVSRDIDKAFP
jgi:nuclear mRNA export protein PCID2/THP1